MKIVKISGKFRYTERYFEQYFFLFDWDAWYYLLEARKRFIKTLISPQLHAGLKIKLQNITKISQAKIYLICQKY